MAITTLDGALAGMQPPWAISKAATPTLVAGRPHSLWYLGGAPGAASNPANTANGVVLSSTSALVSGQIPHYDPVSGNSYLGRLEALATQAGTLMLCDRLLQCAGTTSGSGISLTTTPAQTINTTTLPARDNAGTTNGAGILVGFEVFTAAGAGTPTLTIGYTNSGGSGSKSATNVDPVVASSAIGAFYRMGLQAGDVGVQSVQTITISATMTSGAAAIVLYRVLAMIELVGAFVPNAIDALTSGFPQIFNGTVPFLIFIPNTTTASNISGSYGETQG